MVESKWSTLPSGFSRERRTLLLTPDQVDALSRLGFLGAVILGVLALYRRIIIFRQEKVESDAEKDARLAEMRHDRDAWKLTADKVVRGQERQIELSEAQARELAKLVSAVERLATIVEHRPADHA